MVHRPHRRAFLKAALALPLAGGVVARAGRSAAPQVRELAPGVRLLTSASGFNSVAVETSEGLALIDAAPGREAGALLAALRAGGGRVRLAFNTHWHPHATGCNEALGRAGTRIVAQENTRQWLQRPIVDVLDGVRHDALPRAAWPTESFLEQERYMLGGQAFECRQLFQAHTDGDMVVRLPEANVLVAGGTVAVGHYPILDSFTGGWIRGMLNATKVLLEMSDASTRIIGENGAIADREHLQAQAEMLETLTERLWQLMRKGLSEEDLVEARPTQDYDARWGDPRAFIVHAYRGIWGHVREMRGIV